MAAITLSAAEPVLPTPLMRFDDQTYADMGRVWNSLRAECEKVLSPEACDALLGQTMHIIPQTEEAPGGLKWYIWLMAGVIIGKVIL